MRLPRLLFLAGMTLAWPLQASAFDYVDHSLQSEQVLPSVCLTFDGALERGNGDAYTPFIDLQPTRDHGLAVRGRDLCITGLELSTAYKIHIKEGLPAADGSKLTRSIDLDVKLPDRAPVVSFSTNKDILPYTPGAGVPLHSVNVSSADINLFRISDRSLADRMDSYWFGESLSDYQEDSLAETSGTRLFSGHVDIQTKRNEEIVTSLPIDKLVPKLQPGLYVMTARPTGASNDDWYELATQWFSVSDIGLFTVQSRTGLLVAARSLQSAEAMADVKLDLIASNNDILGSFKTDAQGLVSIPAGLLRGQGGDSPKLLTATAARGDFTYVQLDGPAMDLSDLDIKGNPQPGPIDAYLWTDRGIYRPGESVRLQALLRNDKADPVKDLPLQLRLIRPDGIEASSTKLDLGFGGGGAMTIPVPDNAYTGTWTIEADAGGEKRVGTVSFVVEDFVPPRIEVKAQGPATPPGQGEPVEVNVDAHYFYGAPASQLTGQANLSISAPQNPFPGLNGYSFGLVQNPFSRQQADPASFSTDANGQATLPLTLPSIPDATQPLQATVDVDVFDLDGRPAHTQVTVPLHIAERYIGVKPTFSWLGANEDATFDVVLIDAAGKPIQASTLRYDLVEEDWVYKWYRDNGRWRYESNLIENRIANGEVAIDDNGKGKIKAHATSGSMRLEVYDASGRTASSTRFYAGWWAGDSSDNKPETMPVELDPNGPADSLRLHIKPSFDAQVMVFVGDADKESVAEFDIGKDGKTVEIPKRNIPAAGTYVTAVAFGKTGAVLPRLPVRALGTVWVAGAAAERRLQVDLKAPARVQPNGKLEADLDIKGATAGKTVYATVSAVDDAVLQMTDFKTPDPAEHYLGRRMLGLQLRDVYGRLIDPSGQPGNIVSGGDARAKMQIGSLEVKTFKTVALFSGPLQLDSVGHAHLSLDVPDFSGRLRLMAVTWSDTQYGSAEAKTEIRPPVLAELSLPRFLAPGDKARLRASITVLEAPEQDYTVKLETDGPIRFERDDISFKDVKHDRRRFADRMLVASDATGVGHIRLIATGADGTRFEHSFEIAIRSPNAYVTTRQVWTIQPSKSLELNGALATNMLGNTGEAALSVSTMPAFDVPGLLAQLRRYPYGCAEQTVSRAFPELYADALQIDGVKSEDIGGVISRLASLENAGGGFGYWSAYENANLWLTAYVMDFFETAAERGTPVPDGLFNRTATWLNTRFASLGTKPYEIYGGSYASLVLARAGQLDLSRLRYFALNSIGSMPSEVSKLQTAAALRRLGDDELAKRVLASPVVPTQGFYSYYSSDLTERAMELTIAAEEDLLPANRLAALADQTARGLARQQWLSTQDAIWLLRATAALRSPGSLDISLDGKEHKGIQSIAVKSDLGKTPTTLRNLGSDPIYAMLSLTGIPQTAPPAEANGFTIDRSYFLPDGTPVDPSKLTQNQRLVVFIRGKQDEEVDRKALIVDLLPAGLEPETANLPTSDDESAYSWLGSLTVPDFTGTRDDRYVAAVSLDDYQSSFQLAYLVRVVTPGNFALPGVQVEDMNAPEFHARNASGRVEIAPAPAP